MTTAATDQTRVKPTQVQSPEDYRMSLGEHLEELRWRMVLALVGFVVVGAVCLIWGDEVVAAFCRPLYDALKRHGINPMIYVQKVSSAFMVYFQMSLISAAALAAPWIVYQIWQFIAAGLYPHERKWITRYIPFSVGLLIGGMLFVYFFVLPLTLNFFIGAHSWFRMPEPTPTIIPMEQVPALTHITPLAGDPATVREGDLWYNTQEHKLKFFIHGKVSVLQFLPLSLVAPHITLDEYISLVVMMLLTFGLAFQLPLVVMAILRIGIFEPQQLKDARRIVYFVLVVIAAVVTPGDVITATIALLFPLILLYELGIFLGSRSLARAQTEEPEASNPHD